MLAQGREIYNLRCYFCHGYSGNAKTLATTYLKPEPRDFTAMQSGEMSAQSMFDVVKNGKLGTAMNGFSYLLSDQEIMAVVKFITAAFMENKQINTYYHIDENGWGEHERYAVAFPFVRGEILLDTPWEHLTEEQVEGKRLFMSGCVTCHDRAYVNNKEVKWQSRSVSYPRGKYSHKDAVSLVDDVLGASPFSAHDLSPQIPDLTVKERQGQSLFVENCAFCHGGDGKGVNWIGSFLESRPRDLTSDDVESVSDLVLFNMIREGVPNTTMPAWKNVLTDEQIETLMVYIRRAFH
ncbi:MAG: c-type cytochrome [Gammaproteobacteria bacterium]|nr:c-type cytochrome [Gammaproteobacteria bacterium]